MLVLVKCIFRCLSGGRWNAVREGDSDSSAPQARKLVKNLSVPWLMGSSQGIHSFLIDGIDRWVDIVAYVPLLRHEKRWKDMTAHKEPRSLAVSQQRDNQLGGISTWSHLLVPSKEFPVGDGHA